MCALYVLNVGCYRVMFALAILLRDPGRVMHAHPVSGHCVWACPKCVLSDDCVLTVGVAWCGHAALHRLQLSPELLVLFCYDYDEYILYDDSHLPLLVLLHVYCASYS